MCEFGRRLKSSLISAMGMLFCLVIFNAIRSLDGKSGGSQELGSPNRLN